MLLTHSTRAFRVLSLGEVMLRLSPFNKERIAFCDSFSKTAGGSELNVAAGVSALGMRAGIITKLPSNEIGEFIKHKIRFSGVSDDYVVYDTSADKRLGIYYSESGAYPRLPEVLYDRRGSSFTTLTLDELSSGVFHSADIFHLSGITLALGDNIRSVATQILHRFRDTGTAISLDVNYRSSLWSEDTAREVIRSLLPFVNILFVSEETLRKMLCENGTLAEIQERYATRYPSLRIIASTQRRVKSARTHSFTSLVYDAERKIHYSEGAYEDIDVIDRIGSGDAYVAGALYGIIKDGTVESIAKYGNAMAALKSTTHGDMSMCNLTDVERVIKNHAKSDGTEMIR